MLPCHLRENPLRPFPDTVLPCLIEQQDAHAESHGEEPMSNRDGSGSQHGLDLRNIQEEDGNQQGKDDGREEVGVASVRAEERRVLENA